MTQLPTAQIRFGLFEVDLRSGELRRNGYKIDLQDQPFQALLLLLQHPGELVSRDDLQKHLWPQDTFVDFDRGLNKAINKLRFALRDNAEKPRYIETLPQRGYRFIAPIELPSSEASETVEADQGPTPAAESIAPDLSPFSQAETANVRYTPSALPLQQSRRQLLLYSFAVLVILGLAICGRYAWTTLHAKTVPAPLAAELRLTTNSSDIPITSFIISPDGKYLAYTDSTGLYLRLLANGETHSVSLPKDFKPSLEGWFPDSVHLVASWIEHSEKPPSLWTFSALGGIPRKLADVGSGARVSPDGNQVVFLKGPWDASEIWSVDANGNGARKLLSAGRDSFGPVAWAPDGTRFAYVRSSTESPKIGIETYSLQDGSSSTILSGPGIGGQIAWLQPSRLVYSRQESAPNQGDFDLWAIEVDAPTGRPSGTPACISRNRDAITSLSSTSDGRRIALLRSNSQADVYLAELDARGKTLRIPQRFTHDDRQDFPSSWTPDSQSVLIVSDRDGPSHIFRQKVGEVQPHLLVGGTQDVWLPHVTPDGANMLYLASSAQVGAADKVRLMRTSLSGGPSDLVLEEPGIVNYQCARFPSRLCVYGQIDAQYYRFFKFDPYRGNSTEISAARLRKEVGLNSWNLSPDGKYLVTCKSQDPYQVPGLRVFDIADWKEKLLPVAGIKLIIGTDWAADSRSIWVGGFMGRGSWGTRSGLVRVDLSGHARTWIEGETPEILGATPSPDGHRIAIGANSSSSNGWLIENF